MTDLDPVSHAISHWGADYSKLQPESDAYKRGAELTAYHFQLSAKAGPFLPSESPAVRVVVRAKRPTGYVGEPLNFRGLMYEPVNENGVIFLFALVARDLGFYVEGIQQPFPDAFGRRKMNGRLYSVGVEFKFRSSGYKQYYKEDRVCDVVVCWEHDWKECPVEVIELKSRIKQLTT